jgi:hypothetical protein
MDEPTRSTFQHQILSELLDGTRARGWHWAPREEWIDLARVIAERGSVPPARVLGPLTRQVRAANMVTVIALGAMVSEAVERAQARAKVVAWASEPGRTKPAAKPTLVVDPTVNSEALLALRVKLVDRTALEQLRRVDLERYLTARGWREVEIVRLGAFWRHGHQELRVVDDAAADRVARWVENLEALEQWEDRGQLLIFRDLLATRLS